MGHSKGSPEREVHRDTAYLKKKKKKKHFKQTAYPYTYKNSRNNNKDSPEQVEGRK